MVRITKNDIINRLAEHNTFETKKAAGEALDIVLELLTDAATTGKEVHLGNSFGTFKPGMRAARNGVNPSTGEKMAIPACKTFKFQASSSLKTAING